MASPFRIFRKNVKPMLAVIVVLLMLSWVIGDSLFTWFAGDRDPARRRAMDAGTVAVRWDGGKLTNQQLHNMVSRRHMLNAFLQAVEMEGARSAYEAGVEPSQLRVQRLIGPQTAEQGVERSVVETKLAADAAREAGMRVSDESIVRYLDQLGRGNVTRDTMRSILTQMASRTGGFSIDDVMAALREEMLGQNYLNSNRYAMVTVTPEQRWKDWLRVNERVVVEAASVPAESLLVDVKDPTDAELQEFFDKYKDREASPEIAYGTTELPSATPGFRIPRKIDLAYIDANYDSFLTKAEEKVTDEEIAKYYEAHKDPMFIKADTGLMEDKGDTKDEAAAPATGATPPSAEEKAAEPPATPPATDAQPPATDAQPPATDAQPPATEEKDAAKEDKQSSFESRPSNSPFRQVAFFQEEKKDDAGKTDEKDAKTADTAAKTADPAAPGTPVPPPVDPNVTTPPPTPPAGAPPAAATAAPVVPKKPPEFQPLDQVKDQIRRELASEKVAEELKKLVEGIQGPLDTDFNKYQRAVLTADADKQPAPPVPPSLTDLAPLAEKNGLKASTTGPMSFLEFRNTPLGKSGLVDSGRPLLNVLFGSKEIDLYQPVVTMDIDGNRYIMVKQSDTPGRVPKLDDVKAEVIKAYKAQKAAELAEKHAEELAKKAGEAQKPLTEYFADDPAIKVTRTDPFSELTGGDVGIVNGQLQRQPYRLSQPEGIVAPGPDFMKEVFSLKDGQVGAALNHDHTIAYVIRIVEHQPPINELRTAYLGEANTWPGLMSETQRHAAELAQGLASDLTSGTNLKWERQADKIERPGEEAESDGTDTPDAG